MTKAEFLAALKRALPEDEAEQTLAFYNEMIDDRMEDGMSEEEAVAAMGPVSQLAGRAAAAEAEAPKQDGGDQPIKERIEQKLEAWEPQKMRFTAQAETVRDLRIKARNMPVTVTSWDRNEIDIVYYTSEREPYSVTVDGSTVSLAPDWLNEDGHFEFSFTGENVLDLLGRVFTGVRKQFRLTVEVCVPRELAARLTVETSNGGVSMENIDCWGDVSLSTRNARVQVKNASAKTITLVSSNGAVSLVSAKISGAAEVHTSNSGVTVVDCSAGDLLDVKTSNAHIEAVNDRAKTVNLVTSNSRITVGNIAAEDITLKTSNGRITGVLPGCMSDYAITSGTSNGKNNLPNGTQGAKKLSAHTSNSSIDIQFSE